MEYSSIDALFERFVHDSGAPGIAYGVTLGGHLVYARALGTAEVGGARPPLDADSVFRVASMTKSFTAAAVLLLRDRGLVALDADIRTYLPEFNPAGAPAGSPALTLRYLLSMNAGLPTDGAPEIFSLTLLFVITVSIYLRTANAMISTRVFRYFTLDIL